MKKINWFNVLTEERRWELIKDAAIELKVLIKNIPEAWKRIAIILSDCSPNKKDRLVLLNGEIKEERPSCERGKRISFTVTSFDYKKLVEKFQITPDQLRELRLSLTEKSREK